MTTIITKHGSGAPAALDLSQGELAIDLTNKELYTKDGDGNVIKVSGTGGGEAGSFTDLTATSSFTSPGIDDNAASTAITINASQKVGIGTDDPQQLLEVSASLNPVIRLDSSLVGNENDFDNKFMGGVEWYTNDTTGIGEHIGASLRAFSNASVATTTPGYELIFSTSLADVAESEAMRIDGNGNVGIGESNPDAKLTIKDTATASTNPLDSTHATISLQYASTKVLNIGDYAASPFASYIQSTNTSESPFALALNPNGGNVGIGTNAPSEKLTVAGSGTTARISINDTDTAAATMTGLLEFDGSDTRAGYVGYVGGNMELYTSVNDIRLSTGGAQRIAIKSGGNVGIGTTSPIAKTHIAKTSGTALVITSEATNANTQSGYIDFQGSSSGTGQGARIAAPFETTYGRTGLAFYTSNTASDTFTPVERMRIDSSGRLLAGGSTAPSATTAVLSLQDPTTNGNTVQFENGNNTGGALVGASSSDIALKFFTYTGATGSETYSEAMRIDSSGRVGIGETNPAYSLTIGDGTDTQEHISLRSTDDGKCYIFMGDATDVDACRITYENNTNTLLFSVNGNQEAMRIDSSGNLLVGATSFTPAAKDALIQLPGQIRYTRTTTGDVCRFYSASTEVGSIYVGSTNTSYVTSSDVRLKENIQDADSSGSIIDAIQVRQYDWKADGSHDDYGFVAQELEQVYPKAVSKGETEDDMWGVDYSKLVPLLVKEIQELKAEVAALKGA